MNTLDGIWKGIVEDTTDPNNLGRMRIRVPEIHGTQGNIPTVDLPWSGVCLPAHSFAIPVVGDGVWVMFEKGDVHFPVYMGTMKFLSLGITPKGALPSSSPLSYQAPGNSPPPPLPPDVSIINAQRQSAATVLGVDVNLVPYPAGYGLDSVGAPQNAVNATLQTAVNQTNILFAAAIATPDAELNAAMTAVTAQAMATVAAAQAAANIPQLFTSTIASTLATSQSLLAQLQSLSGLPPVQIQAGLSTAQATMNNATAFVTNIVSTLTSVLAAAVSQLQSSVVNFETYFQLPGIETPAIALAKQSPDPVVRVLIQSPSGHTVAANDDPGNEFLRIIDRVGQILNFDGAVSKFLNTNNRSQRTGDILHGGAIPILSAVNQRATITLMDLMGQFLQLDANDPAGVSQAKVILQGVSNQALIIDGTLGAEKITLEGKAGGFLIIDSSTGDPHVTLEDATGNNILMTPAGIVITDVFGNKITTSSSGIVFAATAVKGGGATAVKHLVFLEDIIPLFNTHFHPVSGGPPDPANFIKPINGTAIMTGE